jgi:hypothetical protein
MRARTGILHSLMRTLEKRGSAADRVARRVGRDRLLETLRAPGIAWVDEELFIRTLDAALHELGDDAYQQVVHDSCMLMLQTGIARVARAASNMFVKPSISGYAHWAVRIWSISFEGLQLDYCGRQSEGIRMELSNPPRAGFCASIVLGTVGILRTVFTLARAPGDVTIAPYRDNDERISFWLKSF